MDLRRILAVAALLGGTTVPVMAQELEPRVYSASPIDTNFVVGTYTHSTGTVALDPTLPLSNVRPAVDTAALSFFHTFPLAGHTATWAVAIPYVAANVTGTIYGRTQATTRNGFPDARFRFAVNLLGRALTPVEFARRKPATTLGVGITAIAPTGTYDPSRLVNAGSNRWSFKPEVGLEIPLSRWFADFAAGVWVFGNNTNYLGGQTLRQAPLANCQVHAGYNVPAGQWLAVDWGYYAGGATTAGAGKAINPLSNSRYGLTFSQPLGSGISAKLSWSNWLSGQYGQKFSTIGAALQYRWFNRL